MRNKVNQLRRPGNAIQVYRPTSLGVSPLKTSEKCHLVSRNENFTSYLMSPDCVVGSLSRFSNARHTFHICSKEWLKCLKVSGLPLLLVFVQTMSRFFTQICVKKKHSWDEHWKNTISHLKWHVDHSHLPLKLVWG